MERGFINENVMSNYRMAEYGRQFIDMIYFENSSLSALDNSISASNRCSSYKIEFNEIKYMAFASYHST